MPKMRIKRDFNSEILFYREVQRSDVFTVYLINQTYPLNGKRTLPVQRCFNNCFNNTLVC